jgi:uncharacterized membrane protein YfcA
MMDMAPLDLALFLAATFGAALVAGLAGFAFGLVAAAVWLHVLTPLQTAMLIVAYGLIVQGWAVWKLRAALKPARLLPFVVGGLLGIPLGVELLRRAPAAEMRMAIGAFLVAFSLYNLFRPALRPAKNAGPLADGGIGVASGIIGGATGLAGILPTIWSGLRGWPRDEQRAVFQPTGVAIFLGSLAWMGGRGTIDGGTARLFAVGLPALLAGTWLGLKLYGRLDEAGFRRVAAAVLLLSGVALVLTGR